MDCWAGFKKGKKYVHSTIRQNVCGDGDSLVLRHYERSPQPNRVRVKSRMGGCHYFFLTVETKDCPL